MKFTARPDPVAGESEVEARMALKTDNDNTFKYQYTMTAATHGDMHLPTVIPCRSTKLAGESFWESRAETAGNSEKLSKIMPPLPNWQFNLTQISSMLHAICLCQGRRLFQQYGLVLLQE